MKKHTLKTKDNANLSIHTFDAASPKAIIQIVHGMEEHQERYEDFAHFLNQNGYTVVTANLRGHGSTAKNLGHFKDKNGYIALIKDQILIRKFITKHYPDIPVYLFAHSMGTVISRVLLQTQSLNYNKIVLSGYPCYQMMSPVGIPITSLIRFFCGAKYKSKLVQYLTVGVFNNKIPNPVTPVDWVCANPDTVKAYINNPYCGIGFTCSAFNDLYHLVIKMHNPHKYINVHSDMPILMISGADDPCTGGKKGTADSIRILKQAGFSSISKIEYQGMRHEILNEKENAKVYQDIVAFYDR